MTSPLVTIRYENGAFGVAYGLRPEGDPDGEAGFDRVVDGVAIALGIVMSQVALMDPDFMENGMDEMKAKFWASVEEAIETAQTMEGG